MGRIGRRRDLIGGRMELIGRRRDLSGEKMALVGRGEIANVNFARALNIFVRFFEAPACNLAVNLAAMQRNRLIYLVNFPGPLGIHFIFLLRTSNGLIWIF